MVRAKHMPELPEVETVRRGLAPVLTGARFKRVEPRRPDLRFPFPRRFAARLEGDVVVTLARRAKYLLAHLASGEVLVMHLGMSGRFTVRAVRPAFAPSPLAGAAQGGGRLSTVATLPPPSHSPPGDGATVAPSAGETGSDAAHDHVVFTLESGVTIVYNDPRRFGFMTLIGHDELASHKLFRDLGVEPLGNEFHADYLSRKARGRTADLKAFLLDQRIVAGLGNIYVSEALHRAGLNPNRAASCLVRRNGRPAARAERLVPAIRAVLEEAIAAGGSTLRDYRHSDGSFGDFQHLFAVYGREGEPCLKEGCRGIVRRSVQGGRSTFYCGSCQR
jgi:formamidopyrimidine-DNA glycosylase